MWIMSIDTYEQDIKMMSYVYLRITYTLQIPLYHHIPAAHPGIFRVSVLPDLDLRHPIYCQGWAVPAAVRCHWGDRNPLFIPLIGGCLINGQLLSFLTHCRTGAYCILHWICSVLFSPYRHLRLICPVLNLPTLQFSNRNFLFKDCF